MMLRRAFNNLISNAIHHSFKGSEINIKIQEDELGAVVAVINHDETIPGDTITHIFDRFYLANTQSIAKAHGSSISVTSSNQVTTLPY